MRCQYISLIYIHHVWTQQCENMTFKDSCLDLSNWKAFFSDNPLTHWIGGLIFIDNDCVTLPLVFALHGIQPGIHKVSHLLCITMSKTFTVLEQMPCSHITAPLATVPADLMKLCVPRRTPLVKPLLTAHFPHQEGLLDISLSPHTWFCTVCYFVNGRASQRNLQLLFLLVLVSTEDPCRSLPGQRLPGKVASQWSSSEYYMTGHVMICWNAHRQVSLFQTSHLKFQNIPSFKCQKERTVDSSQCVALMVPPAVKNKACAKRNIQDQGK